MGNYCTSKQNIKDVYNPPKEAPSSSGAAAPEKAAEAPPRAASSSTDDFVARPFAFMRLTHEAIRSCLSDLRKLCEKLDTAEAGSDSDAILVQIHNEFDDLYRLIDIHSRQEDDVFFPLLDAMFDNVVTKSGFTEDHVVDHKLQYDITKAFAEGLDKDAIKEAMLAWMDAHEIHLKSEEDVMMPLTPQIADSVEGRAAEVNKIMNHDREELIEFQVAFVLGKLARDKPYGPIRMYCCALQESSTRKEYEEIVPIIKDTITKVKPEYLPKLETHGVFGPGKLKIATTSSPLTDDFVARPFAFMRLTHEAIRSCLSDLRKLCEKLDTAEAGSDSDAILVQIHNEFDDLYRLIDIHSRQEDDVFFPLLDAMFDSTASKSGFTEDHVQDHKLQYDITKAFAEGLDKDAVKEALLAWMDAHEIHLKSEEDVMMPLTPQIADSVEGRAAEVNKIMNHDRAELIEFQVAFVLGKLARDKPYGPVRMYCCALQESSTAVEFEEIKPIIKDTITKVKPEYLLKLETHGVFGPGKL